MAFLNYVYRMRIGYEEAISKCYFTIKAIPADDLRQKNISYELALTPPVTYSVNTDSFGNRQIYGSENVPHRDFEFVIRGLAETNDGIVCAALSENRLGMYKYPYGKCIPGESITAFAGTLADRVEAAESTYDKAILIMDSLHERMIYESGSTNLETTAEEALFNGKGVCQDYAHIYISLLKLFGIPARYVSGLVVGEGKSHAWVEAFCDGNFIGLDPTYDQVINEGYIKLGVGRDATDCSINRGVMWGGGRQSQEIDVSVKNICQ